MFKLLLLTSHKANVLGFKDLMVNKIYGINQRFYWAKPMKHINKLRG